MDQEYTVVTDPDVLRLLGLPIPGNHWVEVDHDSWKRGDKAVAYGHTGEFADGGSQWRDGWVAALSAVVGHHYRQVPITEPPKPIVATASGNAVFGKAVYPSGPWVHVPKEVADEFLRRQGEDDWWIDGAVVTVELPVE